MVAEIAVSDTGPFIHLFEIGHLETLRIADTILIPPKVNQELMKGSTLVESGHLERVEVRDLGRRGRDRAAALSRRYRLGLAEAQAISLSLESGVRLILTDDLDAREAARSLGLDPHGSVGILLRAFRQGMLSQEDAIQAIEGLNSKSSLYLTSDLAKRATEAIRTYR